MKLTREQRRKLEDIPTLEDLEREHIEYVLEVAPTVAAAAEVLGIDQSTLWRKRKRFDLK